MSKKDKKNRFSEESIMNERRFMIGPKLSFAAAESYKLLRTNLMFSFANMDINGGKVISITSSVPSEGKSITMLNLAYTFAESKKKVILIEGDMRLPTLASRLKLKPTPGLSNLMVESNSVNGAIQKFTTIKDGTTRISIDVIVAGTIPPNPSELLSSERFDALLKILRENYDYIFLDQPPVTVVTDALITSEKTDGTIVVVRNNHTDRGALAETMRQLKLVNARVLGFVYNGSSTGSNKYYKKGYNNGYYKQS